jgi:hypothetical protein
MAGATSSHSTPRMVRSGLPTTRNSGLHAYMNGAGAQRTRRVASQILAGRLPINGMLDDQPLPRGFEHRRSRARIRHVPDRGVSPTQGNSRMTATNRTRTRTHEHKP